MKIHATASKSLGLILTILLACSWASTAAAETAKLTDTLGTIKWGDSKDDVLTKLRDQRLDKLKQNKKLVKDRVRMQRARQSVINWHERVGESYTRFAGNTKGYDVSIVAAHYSERNGESMLIAKDRVAQRFYFFKDNKLYKMVVAYNADYVKDVGFESFAASAARKYGRPVSSEYGPVQGEEELVQVTWTDGRNEMDVENMKEFYGTYSMVFKDAARVKRMLAENANAGGAGKGDEEDVSSEIAFLTEDGKSATTGSTLDGIIGGVDVDLTVKELEEEQAQEDGTASKSSKKSKKSKSKKKSKKKRRKKKVSKRDFKNLEAKGDGELIIY